MTHMKTTTRRPVRGFSLIELLVVIAIIALVAGLIIGGVSKLKEGAKESQARTLLANLMSQAEVYETKTQYPVPHATSSTMIGIDWTKPLRQNAPTENSNKIIEGGYANENNNNGNPDYDGGEDNDFYMKRANLYCERFIWAANQLPQIRESLPALGAAFDDFDGDGFMELNDPWGNPIAYASGVSHTDAVTDDDFLPAYRMAFFASAGEDQKWGLARKQQPGESDSAFAAYKKTKEYKDSLDNIYSFDMDRSAAARGE